MARTKSGEGRKLEKGSSSEIFGKMEVGFLDGVGDECMIRPGTKLPSSINIVSLYLQVCLTYGLIQ